MVLLCYVIAIMQKQQIWILTFDNDILDIFSIMIFENTIL